MAKGTKKSVGPKEAQLRALREGNSDAADILKQLEQQEREAYAAFEEQQRERREKALSAVIEPLRDERNKLAQQVNEANTRIGELDRQIAKLTGRDGRQAGGGTGKRRQRRTAAEKMQIATLVHGLLKQHKGKRYSAGELENQTQGVPLRELREIWNETNKDAKISREGDKSTARYFVE